MDSIAHIELRLKDTCTLQAEWLTHTFSLLGEDASVSFKLSKHCKQNFRYWLSDTRIQRSHLLTFMCGEELCPKRQRLIESWQAHNGILKLTTKNHTRGLAKAQLAQEVVYQVNGITYYIREAIFNVVIKCPEMAHEPIKTSGQGWDVFSGSGYVSGGLINDRPLFQTVGQAKEWLHLSIASY